MIPELLPVVLRFTNVASNSNINFTFTTDGAYWSLGARSGDSMGFAMLADVMENNAESCIQKIEFNENMLSLRTTPSSMPLSNFTLTLFLRVKPGVDYLQGYCTLNNEASVFAYFGAQRPMEWRNGRISAVLRRRDPNFRRIYITVQGAHPGNRIGLEVTTKKGLGAVSWCLGPGFDEAEGVLLTSANGFVPLTSMSYGANHILFETARNERMQEMDFLLLANITWQPEDLPYIYLKANCDRNVTMYAHVGNRQPQLISQTYTVFTI